MSKISVPQVVIGQFGERPVCEKTSLGVYRMLRETFILLSPHMADMVEVMRVKWEMYPLVDDDRAYAIFANVEVVLDYESKNTFAPVSFRIAAEERLERGGKAEVLIDKLWAPKAKELAVKVLYTAKENVSTSLACSQLRMTRLKRLAAEFEISTIGW